MIYDVAVVGAGACGLTTAIFLNSKKTILFDSKTGAAKLSITGNNRCNITNLTDFDSFFDNYKPNGQFLRNSLSSFSQSDLIKFLKSLKIKTKTVKNRVVLENSTSKELSDKILKTAVKKTLFFPNTPIVDMKQDNELFILKTKKTTYKSKFVVLACGGMSYPQTGSNGLCYKTAAKIGHTIIKPAPFEVPFCSENTKNLQGLSFSNVELTLKIDKKKIKTKGDIIFTHFGISGPAILKLSENDFKNAELIIKLINKDEDEIKQRLLNYKGKAKKIIKKFLSVRFVDSNIKTEKYAKELSKKDINQILDTIFRFSMDVKKCSFDRAFVTKGGVSLKEINPKTMESNIIKNLFFCGEIMDIQGSIGGFNLQAAFSTGFLTAKTINARINNNRH